MRAYHCLVTGDSGGGKTTFLREMHDRFVGMSIVVNHTGERGFAGRRVSSRDELHASDSNTIDFRTDDVIEGSRVARAAGREYHERTGYPFQVIVDEAQDRALPDGRNPPDTPVKRGLHQDRDHGGKWVVATQDPTDLHYTPLKQCRYMVWCGPPHPLHEGFARYFSLPKEDFPTKEYETVTFVSDGDPFRWTVAHRGETSEKYA